MFGSMKIFGISKLFATALTVLFMVYTDARGQSSDQWFEVVAINPGLGEVPADLDRSTPHGSLEAFFDAVRNNDYERAAHLLDLTGFRNEKQASSGPELARQLGNVVERRLWIDWSDLPDRPDALLEVGPDSNPMVGRPRRSLRLDILDVENRPVSLRLNRLKPQTGDAVWVFSRQTVANIEALHLQYGPGWFESKLPTSWREQSYLGLRAWELVALPVVILLASAIFFLVRLLVSLFARRADWNLAQDAANAARAPLALFASAAVLDYLTAQALGFSSPVTTVLSPILLIAMAIAVTLAILRAIDSLLDIVTHRYVGEIDDEQSAEERSFYTSIYALRRIVVLIALVLGTGIVLTQLHLFETLGLSLIASAGVLTVVLGVAGQTVLGNILASLQIALAKPIRIGDSVYYEGDWAYVEAIFYTFVRLRTWDDRRLIVPVKYFVSTPFENWSMQDAKMTRTFTLVLDHAANVQPVRDAFIEFAEKDEDVIEHDTSKVLVTDHDHNGKHVRFYATAPDPTAAWRMHARLREKTLQWIEDNHAEWWPRERVVDAGDTAGGAQTGAAVGDPGG